MREVINWHNFFPKVLPTLTYFFSRNIWEIFCIHFPVILSFFIPEFLGDFFFFSDNFLPGADRKFFCSGADDGNCYEKTVANGTTQLETKLSPLELLAKPCMGIIDLSLLRKEKITI